MGIVCSALPSRIIEILTSTSPQFTAAIAGYIALAGLLTKDTSFFTLPVGDLSRPRLKA